MSVYEIKPFKTTDIFSAVKLIKKFGIEEVKKLTKNIEFANITDKEGNINVDRLGYELAMPIIELIVNHLGDCENEIYQFLEGTSNLTKEQIKSMKATEFIKFMQDYIKFQKDDFSDFFSLVSQSLKSE